MRRPSHNSKKKCFLNTAWGVLFMLAGFSCPAQDQGRLPDSVSTSVDSITPSGKSSATKTEEPAPLIDSARADSVAQPPDSVVLRAVPDSTIAGFKQDRDFAYANDPDYWRIQRPQEENGFILFLARLFSSRGFRYTVYALAIGLLLLVLYRIIAQNKLYLFYKAPRKIKKLSGEGEETDIQEEDLDKRIQEAVQARDFRVATRWLFLKALRLLDHSALIRYQVKTTNEDYIRQMSGYPQGNDFRQLARAYEHVWYGDFPLSGQQGERLVQHFQDFYKTIHQPLK